MSSHKRTRRSKGGVCNVGGGGVCGGGPGERVSRAIPRLGGIRLKGVTNASGSSVAFAGFHTIHLRQSALAYAASGDAEGLRGCHADAVA